MFAERQQQCSARVETAAAAAVAVRPVVPRTDDTALLRRQAAHKEERESAAARPTAQAAFLAMPAVKTERVVSITSFLLSSFLENSLFEGDGKESRPVHASVRVVSLRIVHLYTPVSRLHCTL